MAITLPYTVPHTGGGYVQFTLYGSKGGDGQSWSVVNSHENLNAYGGTGGNGGTLSGKIDISPSDVLTAELRSGGTGGNSTYDGGAGGNGIVLKLNDTIVAGAGGGGGGGGAQTTNAGNGGNGGVGGASPTDGGTGYIPNSPVGVAAYYDTGIGGNGAVGTTDGGGGGGGGYYGGSGGAGGNLADGKAGCGGGGASNYAGASIYDITANTTGNSSTAPTESSFTFTFVAGLASNALFNHNF